MSELFKYIKSLAYQYGSFDALMMNIPSTIKLETQGIKFSTVHSSKGLEAEVVIILPKNQKKDSLYINLNPFVFIFDNINDFTQFIINNNTKTSMNNKNNLNYVALTRSKRFLYEIKIDF